MPPAPKKPDRTFIDTADCPNTVAAEVFKHWLDAQNAQPLPLEYVRDSLIAGVVLDQDGYR